jgi:hypothetical protein
MFCAVCRRLFWRDPKPEGRSLQRTKQNTCRPQGGGKESEAVALYARAAEIGKLLRGDVEDARLALAKYVYQLTLTPRSTPEGPLLDTAGDVEIFNGFEEGDGGCISNGGQRRDRTADAGLFRAALYH